MKKFKNLFLLLLVLTSALLITSCDGMNDLLFGQRVRGSITLKSDTSKGSPNTTFLPADITINSYKATLKNGADSNKTQEWTGKTTNFQFDNRYL